MKAKYKYWNLVILDSSGNTRVAKITEAQLYFKQRFASLVERTKIVPDLEIQRDLIAFKNTSNSADRVWAERCLRCYISHLIKQTCYWLEKQFGFEHNFTSKDLFVYVLDDTLTLFHQQLDDYQSLRYKPLSVKILETFDPQKASLSTWTTRYVKQNRELQNFLAEHEVSLISNWAILNDTNLRQLKKILIEHHNLTSIEVDQIEVLFVSYQDVYCRDRLKNLLSKGQKCQIPSQCQLEEIANSIEQQNGLVFTAQQILFQLESLAQLLRKYRIRVKRKRIECDRSLDNRLNNLKLESLSTYSPTAAEKERSELLDFYQQQFELNLIVAIEDAILNRLNRFKGDKETKIANYFIALELYYCQNKSMSEIAPLINLQAQYHVTRLLKLKELKTDISQKMLLLMSNWILNQSQWVDPELLKQRKKEIVLALSEQIDRWLEDSTLNTLSQSICSYLKNRRNKIVNEQRIEDKSI